MDNHFEKRRSGLLVPKRDILIGGRFKGLLIRDDKVIDSFESKNIVVNQGLDHILQTEFASGGQVTAWFLALFGANYVPVSTDTASTIVSSAQEATAYTATTRIPFTVVEAAQQVTNAAAPATYTFNNTATIYGAFLTSAQAQGSTSGTLFSAAQFSTPKNVVAGDQLLLTYTFAAASS